MNKSEFWKAIWIPIKKRLPPRTDDFVLVWNPIWKRTFLIESYIAHETAGVIEKSDEIISDRVNQVTNDRFFTHWCQPFSPEK